VNLCSTLELMISNYHSDHAYMVHDSNQIVGWKCHDCNMDSEILAAHNLLHSTNQQLRNTSQDLHDVSDVFIEGTKSFSSNRKSISYLTMVRRFFFKVSAVCRSGECQNKKVETGKSYFRKFQKYRKNKKGVKKQKTKIKKSK
jgi:hypothetical protein